MSAEVVDVNAGSLTSGSRIPTCLLVARIEIQSGKGPFVTSPIMEPTNRPKLKKPMV